MNIADIIFGMLSKMKSFLKKINEDGYAGLVETLVGSVMVLLVMGATALAINTGLQSSLQAKGTTKAVNLIEKQFIKAKNIPYSTLGIKTSGEDNANVQNPDNKDTVGCSNYSSEFEGEVHVTKDNGLDYCQVISSETGVGTKYNVETHVTEVTSEDIMKDLDTTFYDFDASTFTAKRVTVKVSWFSGNFTANDLPIMESAQSEIVITPGLGDCVPSDKATVAMECG